MTEIDGSARKHLGEVVAARRARLGLSVTKAAERAGISRNTWSSVESGTKDTEAYVLGSIEGALYWEPGSIDAILDGGEPTVRADSPRQGPTPGRVRLDPALVRYNAILADPDVPESFKEFMRDSMRLWGRQAESAKEDELRRRSA